MADRPGVKLAPAQGDPNKGASHFFIKLPASFSVPQHHHSPEHYVMVVAGTVVFNVDGKDHSLPAGPVPGFEVVAHSRLDPRGPRKE